MAINATLSSLPFGAHRAEAARQGRAAPRSVTSIEEGLMVTVAVLWAFTQYYQFVLNALFACNGRIDALYASHYENEEAGKAIEGP